MFRLFNFKKNKKLNILDKEIPKKEKSISELEQEIEEIYAIVDSKYNRESGKIILNPYEYKYLYKDFPDLVEKTEVMVLEYVQQLNEKERDYIFKSHYEGLDNNMCVYSISKELNKVKGEDYNLEKISGLDNIIIEDGFFHKELGISIIPYSVVINNLGFSRDLKRSETDLLINNLIKIGEGKFECFRNKVDFIERDGLKMYKYYIGNKDDISNNSIQKPSDAKIIEMTIERMMYENEDNVPLIFKDKNTGKFVQFANFTGKDFTYDLPIDEDPFYNNALKVLNKYSCKLNEYFHINVQNKVETAKSLVYDTFLNIFELNEIELKVEDTFELSNVKDDIQSLFQEFNSKNIKISRFEGEGYILENILLEENKEKNSRRLTQKVKDKVWNRDGGKCVECGSNQLLEFDHIIPYSKGGANTYRNIQLLCEPCNRSKSDKIG